MCVSPSEIEWVTLFQGGFTGEVKSDSTFKDTRESDVEREEKPFSSRWVGRQAWMQALETVEALDRLVGGRSEQAGERALKIRICDILKVQKKDTLDIGFFFACLCPSVKKSN